MLGQLPLPLIKALQKALHPFALTGVGGWLGQAALAALQHALGDDVTDRVLVFGREEKIIPLPLGGTIQCYRMDQLATKLPLKFTLMHFAFLTRDKVADMSLPDYMAANTALRQQVLTALETTHCQGLFVPSSGAVYLPRQHEDDAQVLDTRQVENPYGWLKQQDEIAFARIAESQGFPTTLLRLFNLSGPYINKHALYALSSMIGQAQETGRIRIQADRRVYRSFVHVWDVLAFAWLSLLKPQSAELIQIVDTRGSSVVDMQDLAETVLHTLGLDRSLIKRPSLATDKADDYYVGQADTFGVELMKHQLPLMSLEEQVADTADYLRRQTLVHAST